MKKKLVQKNFIDSRQECDYSYIRIIYITYNIFVLFLYQIHIRSWLHLSKIFPILYHNLYQSSRHIKFIPQCNLISPVLRFIHREIYDKVVLGDLCTPLIQPHFSFLDVSRLISGQIKGNSAYIFCGYWRLPLERELHTCRRIHIFIIYTYIVNEKAK